MFTITTVLLIGGGHAHLQCIKQQGKNALPESQVLLVSANRYQYYSGMFSGYAEGIYDKSDIRIDLKAFCEKNNTAYLEDSVVAIQPEQKKLLCKSGRTLSYDLVSFNIGSSTHVPFPTEDSAYTVKPNYTYTETIQQLRDTHSPVIIGGGSAGVELSLSILARKKRLQQEGTVTLVSSTGLLSEELSNKLTTLCRKKGLKVYTGENVEHVSETKLQTDKRTLTHSGVLLLTGPSSASMFKESGLRCSEDGFLLVNNHLQSESDPSIFGAGDCVTLSAHPNLPKNGVFAVRQGPVLWKNLQQVVAGKSLKPFQPQKRFLSILSTGNKEALLLYDSVHIHGTIPWRIKNRIDRAFMDKFR
ncbi:NADH dehydrogenase-like protein [Bacillus sp. THAF10]|nr:NADH dehydrogenase-like protein [Bacillus sp. THAF10]